MFYEVAALTSAIAVLGGSASDAKRFRERGHKEENCS